MEFFAKIKKAARNTRMMMSNYGMVVENIQNVNAIRFAVWVPRLRHYREEVTKCSERKKF